MGHGLPYPHNSKRFLQSFYAPKMLLGTYWIAKKDSLNDIPLFEENMAVNLVQRQARLLVKMAIFVIFRSCITF